MYALKKIMRSLVVGVSGVFFPCLWEIWVCELEDHVYSEYLKLETSKKTNE